MYVILCFRGTIYLAKGGYSMARQKKAEETAEVVQGELPVTLPTDAVEEPKKKRGRKPGVKNAARKAVVTVANGTASSPSEETQLRYVLNVLLANPDKLESVYHLLK
jgi:hypothetical protein